MKLSSDYLRDALEKMGDKSQNKKAEELMLKGNTLSQYMTGERIMDDFACIMVAKVLGIDGMEVIAAAQMEREKNDERRAIWEDFRKKLGVKLGTAGLALILTMGSLTPDRAYAHLEYLVHSVHDKSILCQIDDTDKNDENCTRNNKEPRPPGLNNLRSPCNETTSVQP
ncbi:hypothetical protein [Chromobacterium subtsugae]|uniref:hypothetical protein n=1 Tax=Chromobacterium subtsugae TaxID=251747 RepID=UPI000699263E|nr:hypothetical protein [Chromobacterium subtsugae]